MGQQLARLRLPRPRRVLGADAARPAGVDLARPGRDRRVRRALRAPRAAADLARAGRRDDPSRWEFNGNWYRWNAAVDPDAFVGYWRRIVRAMRAQPGAAFRFDWCTNDGRGTVAPDRVYPGDAYVDYIGADVYDHGWSPGFRDPVQRWREIRDQPYGLAWQREFARSRGKPTSFPEWAVVDSDHGGGDSPEFIRRMHDWIESGDVAYSIYFEVDTGARMRLMTGSFPNAAGAFKTMFGAPPPAPASAPSPPPASPAPAAPRPPANKKKKKKKARPACARHLTRVRRARGRTARGAAKKQLAKCRAAAKRKAKRMPR